ncbi:MAG: hypothetical protein ABI135_06280 [Rhodoferax sp.]
MKITHNTATHRSKHLLAATAVSAAALTALLAAGPADAHAIAGNRVFPATMAVDDPGVSDEFDFQYGHLTVPGDNGNQGVNTVQFEWDKRITPNFGLSLGGAYVMQNNPTTNGFDNFSIGAKYQLYVNEAHEFMASVGVDADLGGTGSAAIGETHSTISPTLYIGKGLGDLPDSLAYLRPIAVTAAIGPSLTTGAGQPNAFNTGFTVQYSLPYLQQHVRDIGLTQPFANMIPLVEVALSTSQGQTTGTVNPGVIWMGRYAQVGIEAQIPINRASGSGVGILFQVHFFLDDMAPHSLGKPLFQ